MNIKEIIRELELEREGVTEIAKQFISWGCLFALVFMLSVIGG